MQTSVSVPAIAIESVTKRFGDITAVDDVSLEIRPGEVLALLGPNGAGKTTLLDMVLGFADPNAGSIRAFGDTPKRAASNGHIGAVLQDGGLLDDLTVGETIKMIAACHYSHAPVADVMRRAGVSDFATRKVKKCSGGQKQRLRFALALLTDPQLLILDEPTAGLDATARREFWDTMHAEAQRGRTIVFATHYLREADDYADRVVLMLQGRVIADGSVDDMTAGLQRKLSAQWISATDPYDWAATVGLTPEQVDYDAKLQRIRIATPDTDRIAEQLLAAKVIRHLNIVQPGIEEAFFSLTESTGQEVTS
ncbi:MAG: ABC transporter ATP-binding protein [Yaniella sp.]|uniref:ABC transporter ATP-binding protein n=1 Tax=Yaniella sp. TaxID=2773929 RepID=UPI002647FD1E|nr:ABC transporter ATP-binding protein [Yaniella sp.]MDN5732131.1 ABC transporter ATP-binding protein [Yaniella sp.]MDN5819064.1 ABC transporter ATP-binding protein [Yaniella sp.]MDN5839353.1 ABC transporter ATP-binding protein [Yaniella sp.]MDN6411146.1 ABC transporter ATP-binding protein [Yaniella sp.]MDN6456523.1 ABC transporter ATP-binding protein [Yaniella sp.]